MKNYLIVIVLALLPALCFTQDVNIPDAKFLNRLIDLGVDTSGDGIIQVAEAELVDSLHLRGKGVEDLQGIDAFINLRILNYRAVDAIDLSSNINLEYLDLRGSFFNTIDLSVLTKLSYLDLSESRLREIDLSSNALLKQLNLSEAQLVELDLSGNIFLEEVYLSENELGSIDLTNLQNLTHLDLEDNYDLADIDLSSNIALRHLILKNLSLTEINLMANINLEHLDVSENELTNLEISQCSQLQILNCNENDISILDATQNTELVELYLEFNDLTEIDLSNNTELLILNCSHNDISEVDVSNLPKLIELYCGNRNMSEIDISNNSLLEIFNCAASNLTEIDLSQNSELREFWCSINSITSLDFSQNPNLEWVECPNNELTSLDFSSNPKLYYLYCLDNFIESINFTNCRALEEVWCSSNLLTELDVTKNPRLKDLLVSNNELTSINLTNNPELRDLHLQGNRQLTEIDLSFNGELTELYLNACPVRHIDLSRNKELRTVNIGSSVLEYLNIRNEVEIDVLTIRDHKFGLTICHDDIEYQKIISTVDESIVNLVNDCGLDFSYYKLQGQIFYSDDANCTDQSAVVNESHFRITDQTKTVVQKPLFQQDSFNLFLPEGGYEIELNLQFPELFIVDPAVLSVTLDSANNLVLQDFCISPGQQKHTDVNVRLFSTDAARPGFEVTYKVLFENQGNLSSTGRIVIAYPEELSQLVSSSIPLIEDAGTLIADYIDLNPLEQREFTFTLRLNSPTDDPALTDGIISFTADIIPNENDYFTRDNHFFYNQEVVNSYDPNDKTCLQGSVFLDEMLGSELDYLIRFENEGTASAVNISIVDVIDTSSFEINSLRVTDSSHPVYTQVNNNIVKFVFQDIYLPFEAGLNRGHVSYKIKTRDDLTVGDSLQNTANIYFDFNEPIQTNTTTTEIVTDADNDGYHNLEDCDDENPLAYPNAIEIPDNMVDEDCDGVDLVAIHELSESTINIYPNPAADLINIETSDPLDFHVRLFDAQGRLYLSCTNTKKVKVDEMPAGVYLLEIQDRETGQRILERVIVERL